MTNQRNRNISRRSILSAAGVGAVSASLSGTLASPAAAASTPLWNFDTSNPEDAVKLYAKIAGSLVEQEVYMQYYGEIHSINGSEIPKTILALKGLVRLRWMPGDDGSYSFTNYDQGLFCDHETGKVIESFQNPFTGETNIPLHYKSGPLKSTIGLSEEQENPIEKSWRVTGNQILVHDSRAGSFTNPLTPEKWGKASTGAQIPVMTSSTYFADVREVSDKSLQSTNSDHVWNFITAYPAWMLMGQTEGQVLWHWTARKFANKAEIDPYILGEITSRVPDFLTADKPWPLRSNGWTQYTRERTPQ